MHVVEQMFVEEIRRNDKNVHIKVEVTTIFTSSIEYVKVGVNLGCFSNHHHRLNTIAMNAINPLFLHQLRAL